jgi:hypothetical protein
MDDREFLQAVAFLRGHATEADDDVCTRVSVAAGAIIIQQWGIPEGVSVSSEDVAELLWRMDRSRLRKLKAIAGEIVRA